MPNAGESLTEKEKKFIEEYLIDFNGTRAVIAAGYTENRKAAAVQAHQLLRKPNVQRTIGEHFARRKKKFEKEEDRIIAELQTIAYSQITDTCLWTDNGIKLIPSRELKKKHIKAISEISETHTEWGTALRVKKHDKLKALELLGRHFGMWEDNGNREDKPARGTEYGRVQEALRRVKGR
jgi:phage terminase small subunit